MDNCHAPFHHTWWILTSQTKHRLLCTYTSQIFQFIISILKSPSNPVIGLVQIVWFEHKSHYFQSESHLFVSKTKFHTTFRWPIVLQDCIQFANQIRANNAHKMKYFPNFISYVWHCYYSSKWSFIYINPENVQCRKILVWYQTFDFLSHSYYAIMWFCSLVFDIRSSCTPLSSMTISYFFVWVKYEHSQ